MSELKPCPFCGGLPRLERATQRVWVECTDCGATGQMSNCGNADYAAEAWNARAESDELAAAKARIAALEKALEPFAELRPATARLVKNGGVKPYRDDEIMPFYTKAGDIRRAAALLNKE